jgi:predicted amidohydrolase
MHVDQPTTSRQCARWALPALGAACAYAIWSRLGRGLPEEAGAPESYPLRSVGEDAGKGNLLGIQPRLTPADYASADRLLARLDGYFAAAQREGVLGEKTVAILPEHLGTWLAAAGEKAGVYRAQTVRAAVGLMIAANLPAFLLRLPRAREREWAMATAIRTKAAATAAGYHRIMSHLARRYGVYLVAGSLMLPEPCVRDSELRAGCGPLYNVSMLYGPDGLIREPLVRKVYPTEEELPLLAAGRCGDLPVFPTPAGRLGILICADSWYPECYAALRERGVELIAVTSLATDAGGMDLLWAGYSGAPAPADVDSADVGRLTRAEAWRKYGPATRISLSGTRAGMNVCYRGALWEMTPAGQASAVLDGRTVEYGNETALVNLWL